MGKDNNLALACLLLPANPKGVSGGLISLTMFILPDNLAFYDGAIGESDAVISPEEC